VAEESEGAALRFTLAQDLARRAGAIQRERYETPLHIETKSVDIDLVTEVDHACEALIVGELAEHFPDDAVLAEEGTGSDRPGADWRWVIDPLDGTTNYAHGYPRSTIPSSTSCTQRDAGEAPREMEGQSPSLRKPDSTARCSRRALPTTDARADAKTSRTSRPFFRLRARCVATEARLSIFAT
jgi:hypothetical protein